MAYYGGLSGSGGLSKLGTGTLTLSNLTYTGNTIVFSGGLNINAPSTLTSHLDISAQYGVGAANVSVNGADVTSPNGLYITSPTGSSGTIYGFGANLIATNGAQVTANADANSRAISYGAGNGRPGSGSLTVGTAGDITTLVTANGALDMFYSSGGSAVANFAVNLNGGTLAVSNIQESTFGNQSGTFKFNGGKLKALGNDGAANFFPASPAQLTAVVNGGAIIDDNGFSITIAKALTHGTGTPDGGLTKLGAGTLTLDAANTYTGNTTVSNGVLVLGASGSIANSANIIVNGNATFDVSALGGFVLGSSQTLTNSSSTAVLNGNINTGNGTVSLNYASGTPSFSVTNGTLTIPSGTTFKVDNTGTVLAVGSYKLISTNLNGSGFVSPGTLPAVTVSGNGVVGGAGTPALQVNNSELYLVVPSGVNTNPTNITAVVTGSTLKLGWPGDHLGWTLQTNAVDLANTNYWFPYPGSASVTNVNITINPAQTNVFFRLVYP
jgi:autotransporter-associated beta strand protein